MKRNKPPKKPKRPGKPPMHGTTYRRVFDRIVESICKQTGGSTSNLAEAFHVHECQIKKWRDIHPTFARALKRGRDFYDTECIEQALAKRAKGYNYAESEYVFVPTYTKDGELTGEGDLRLKRKTTKHAQGSVDAQKFWLQCRQPDRWNLPDNNKKDAPVENINEKILQALANKLPD